MGEAKEWDLFASLLQKQRGRLIIIVCKLYCTPLQRKVEDKTGLINCICSSCLDLDGSWPIAFSSVAGGYFVQVDRSPNHSANRPVKILAFTGGSWGEHDWQNAICRSGPCPPLDFWPQQITLQPLEPPHCLYSSYPVLCKDSTIQCLLWLIRLWLPDGQSLWYRSAEPIIYSWNTDWKQSLCHFHADSAVLRSQIKPWENILIMQTTNSELINESELGWKLFPGYEIKMSRSTKKVASERREI